VLKLSLFSSAKRNSFLIYYSKKVFQNWFRVVGVKMGRSQRGKRQQEKEEEKGNWLSLVGFLWIGLGCFYFLTSCSANNRFFAARADAANLIGRHFIF
jgi:hypothetical protein